LKQIKSPDINIQYGFVGHTENIIIENFAVESAYKPQLNYKYKETRNWTHVFEPPFNHPGHEYYRGSSGAPIIDEDNNVVSLLICGDIEKNEIYGVNLKMAIVGFNIEVGNI